MSNEVFPTFSGLDIKVKRSPIWSTEVLTAESGKEMRAAWWSGPRFRYSLALNYLRQGLNGDEAAQLLGFFHRHKGQWDSFWLPDPAVINLIPNGTSEDLNPTGMAALNVSTDAPYKGTKCRKLPGTGSDYAVTIAEFPAFPGEVFFANAMAFRFTNGAYLLEILFVNDSGASVGVGGSVGGSSTPSYAPISCLATAPAGSTKCRVNLWCLASTTVGSAAYFDNLFVGRTAQSGVTAVPDGSNTRVSDDGDYQRRVRFESDELDLERTLMATANGGGQTWEAKTVKLISVK